MVAHTVYLSLLSLYLMAKELAARAEDFGVSISVDYVRRILRIMPPLQAPRHKMARWSDFWQFYCLNPGIMPFSRDPAKRTAARAPGLALVREA